MSDELRKALVARGYALEHRALSYGTSIPAVNSLLADLGEYARQAAEALATTASSPASRSAPDGWVLPAELRELSEKATAGPWAQWAPDGSGYDAYADELRQRILGADADVADVFHDEDLELIVAAVNFVRQALASSPSAPNEATRCPQCGGPTMFTGTDGKGALCSFECEAAAAGEKGE